MDNIKSEQLHLVIGGAFKSPICDTNLFITNQPGFNYVVVIHGKYVSRGGLQSKIINWLENKTSLTLQIVPGFVIERLTSYKPDMVVDVTYGSIHHRDER